MVVRKTLIEAKEWQKGTSEAIRKHLPPGFDPTDFLHCTNGDMVLTWDDEKPFVPPPAPEVPAPAPPASAPSEPAPVEPDRDIVPPPPVVEEIKPEDAPVASQPRSKKSKKK